MCLKKICFSRFAFAKENKIIICTFQFPEFILRSLSHNTYLTRIIKRNHSDTLNVGAAVATIIIMSHLGAYVVIKGKLLTVKAACNSKRQR